MGRVTFTCRTTEILGGQIENLWGPEGRDYNGLNVDIKKIYNT